MCGDWTIQSSVQQAYSVQVDVHSCTAQGDDVFSQLTDCQQFLKQQTKSALHQPEGTSLASSTSPRVKIKKTVRGSDANTSLVTAWTVRAQWLDKRASFCSLIGWEFHHLTGISPCCSGKLSSLLWNSIFVNVELILQFLLIIKLSETPLGSQEKKGRIFFLHIYRKVRWNKRDSEKANLIR